MFVLQNRIFIIIVAYNFSSIVLCIYEQEPVEPGNAPRIGIGHREVICQKML